MTGKGTKLVIGDNIRVKGARMAVQRWLGGHAIDGVPAVFKSVELSRISDSSKK